MGIIIKQSFKGSLWSYIGLVVGYINVGIIMPNYFRPDQVGLLQLFIAITIIFSNFSLLGFVSVINRLFPEFRNKAKNHNGFLFIAFATGLVGFFLSMIVFFILKPHIIESNQEKSPLLAEYIMLLIPLFFFKIINSILDHYNKVLYDAVVGSFWNDFVQRAVNLGLITLFAFHFIDFNQFVYGYIISMCMPAIPLAIVLIRRHEFNLKPRLNFIKPPLAKEMVIVSAFGLINGLSGTLTNNIDKLLINRFLSLEEVGIFSICALFATVIRIPSGATTKISTGIIAQAWKENNKTHIQEIYSKASLNQTIIGSLIFAGILVNIENIFTILPEVYRQGKWVLMLYSLGVLVRVSATTSGVIIGTSPYYRILSLLVGTQIIYTVAFHFTFIPLWGITGAAIAVLLTYITRDILVVGYIYFKMKMFCYSMKHIWVLLIALIAFASSYMLPDTESLILNIFLKSTVTSTIFVVIILSLKISKDLNNLYTKFWIILREKLKI